MASEQFPMFKLATLLARQMSSPIATRVKTYAKSHPRFGTQVCARVAEAYRGGEWAARAWALRLAGTALRHRRPPLPRQQAVDLGADLIGEIVIFTLGSLIIIFEVNRQAAIKEGKALHIKSEWLAVKLCLEELQTEVALQQQELDRLHRTLLQLADPGASPPLELPHEPAAMRAPEPPPAPPPASPHAPLAPHARPAPPADPGSTPAHDMFPPSRALLPSRAPAAILRTPSGPPAPPHSPEASSLREAHNPSGLLPRVPPIPTATE